MAPHPRQEPFRGFFERDSGLKRALSPIRMIAIWHIQPIQNRTRHKSERDGDGISAEIAVDKT